VQSEVDGKPTGWSAYYENGKWIARTSKGKAAK
jgi:DNA topoisomerase I